MKEWLTINELAERTSIPDTSVRRYIGKFPDFFISNGGSRSKRYEESAVKVLTRIKNLYDKGFESDRVDESLRKDFAVVTDVESNGDSVADSEEKATTPTLATAEDVAEIKEALKQQMEFNKQLLERLSQQERYIKESIESRDQKLLETLSTLQEQKAATKEAASTDDHQQQPTFWQRIFSKNRQN